MPQAPDSSPSNGLDNLMTPKQDTLSLSEHVLDELLQDTSKSACSAAESVIEKADLDNDGQLSFVEIANIYAKEQNAGVVDNTSQFEAINAINRLDKNGDNKLSADELLQGLKLLKKAVEKFPVITADQTENPIQLWPSWPTGTPPWETHVPIHHYTEL